MMKKLARPKKKSSARKIVKNSAPLKGLPVSKAEFQIPSHIINQMKEFSAGGFIIITADAKGTPHIYAEYDNLMSQIALSRVGIEYFDRLEQKVSYVFGPQPQDEFYQRGSEEE